MTETDPLPSPPQDDRAALARTPTRIKSHTLPAVVAGLRRAGVSEDEIARDLREHAVIVE